MGFTLLDFILLGIMAVSGLLALMRGFTREALSLIAWIAAGAAGYFASQQPQFYTALQGFLDKPLFAQVAVGLSTFIVLLIVLSIVSVRISDTVIDSAASAVDRTIGFVYGLARGLILVSLAYMLYAGFILQPERHEEWIKGAQSVGLIKSTGELICGLAPANMAEALCNSFVSANSGAANSGTDVIEATPAPEQPVGSGDQQGLNNLSNSAATPENVQEPAQQEPAQNGAQQ